DDGVDLGTLLVQRVDPGEVELDELAAGELAGAEGGVDVVDRRLLQAEGRSRHRRPPFSHLRGRTRRTTTAGEPAIASAHQPRAPTRVPVRPGTCPQVRLLTVPAAVYCSERTRSITGDDAVREARD